jgi:hypothetical protein
VFRNFLETLVSRNTDVEGYWLLGLVVDDIHEFRIELDPFGLPPSMIPWGRRIAAKVRRLLRSGRRRRLDLLQDAARRRFQEQRFKAGFGLRGVQNPELRIVRSEDGITIEVPGVGSRITSRLAFEVFARTESGIERLASRDVLVAPHDAALERRRSRKDWWISRADRPRE